MRSSSRSGPIGWAQPSALYDVRAGGEGGDQLDRSLYRYRVEEVHAHDLAGPVGLDSDVDDRDGRGIGGQDGLGILDDLAQSADDLDFELADLGDGLDDELAVGQVVEIMGERESRQGEFTLLRGDLTPLHSLVEGGCDAAAAGLGRAAGDFGDTHFEALAGGDFGDAGNHESAADHAEPGDGVHLRSNLDGDVPCLGGFGLRGSGQTLRRY